VQRHYSKATTNVNDELENRFLAQDVMDAFGIIYTQYWLKWIAKETFPAHMPLLKYFFSSQGNLVLITCL
jgi:hypothetical protein